MGFPSGPYKILLMYIISQSYAVAWLHSYSMGRHSVVVSLIWPAWYITMGVSTLYFRCFVAFCHWCICNGINSALIYASFRVNIRSDMPCFPGTTLDRLIDTSCHRIEICSTILCLSPRALHDLFILIGLQLLSEKCFPPIHIPKAPLKNNHVGLILNI